MKATERRKNKPGWTCYFSDYMAIRDMLSDSQRGQLLDALILFSLKISNRETIEDDEISDIQPKADFDDSSVKICFGLFAEKAKRDEAAYRTTCKKNIENRLKAGRKEGTKE